MFAGTSGGVVTVGGAAIVVIAVWRWYGCVLAGASGGVIAVGGGAIVVIAIWWGNG